MTNNKEEKCSICSSNHHNAKNHTDTLMYKENTLTSFAEKIKEIINIEKGYCENERLPLRKVGEDGRKQAELGGMEYAYDKSVKMIDKLLSEEISK